MSETNERLGAHNTGGPDDAGDSAHGAPQVENSGGSRDNEVRVNQAFIDAHGPQAGQAFKEVLERVGAANHGSDIASIRDELTTGLQQAGLEVAPVEIDNLADRIARSAHTHVDAHDGHAGEH